MPKAPRTTTTLKTPSCYHCPTCGKQLLTQNKKRHEASHLPPVARGFSCGFCPKRFTQRAAMKTHVNAIHSGEKPHPCRMPGCSQRFADQATRHRHEAAEHPLDLFYCDEYALGCKKIHHTELQARSHALKWHGREIVPKRGPPAMAPLYMDSISGLISMASSSFSSPQLERFEGSPAFRVHSPFSLSASLTPGSHHSSPTWNPSPSLAPLSWEEAISPAGDPSTEVSRSNTQSAETGSRVHGFTPFDMANSYLPTPPWSPAHPSSSPTCPAVPMSAPAPAPLCAVNTSITPECPPPAALPLPLSISTPPHQNPESSLSEVQNGSWIPAQIGDIPTLFSPRDLTPTSLGLDVEYFARLDYEPASDFSLDCFLAEISSSPQFLF